MKITMKDKLEMCEEHILEGKTLSHVCERHNYKDTGKLKYWINLYKKHW
ncbi:MAG: hypothetical protein RSE41_08240 [Clostridia bacterium]